MQPTGSISAAFGDGVRKWSSTTDVPSSSGVYFDHRNLEKPLSVSLSFHSPASLVGQLRVADEKEWKTAFNLTLAPEIVREKLYLGFTSTNNRLPKGESSLSRSSGGGDTATISHVSLYTAKEELDTRLDLSGGAKSEELLAKHFWPLQQVVLADLGRLDAQARAMAQKLDIIQAQIMSDARVEKLEKISKLLSDSHSESVDKFQDLQTLLDSQNFKFLETQSSDIHSAVRTVSTLALGTIAVASGSVLVGLFIYKRMRDMEKKHIL